MQKSIQAPSRESHQQIASMPMQSVGTALNQLRQFIRDERLQPGSRLPSERQLAEKLGVGRPAVREAIQALSVLEVLTSRRGSGTYIRSLVNLGGGWPTDPHLESQDFDLIELVEIRKMIEPQAAALAAGRANSQQLHEIKVHLVRLSENLGNIAVREQEDYLFHDAIIRAAGNRILQSLSDTLTPLLLKSRRITGPTHHDFSRIVEQHRAIYEAIRRGDATLAEEAMRQHLLSVGIDLISKGKPESRKSELGSFIAIPRWSAGAKKGKA